LDQITFVGVNVHEQVP